MNEYLFSYGTLQKKEVQLSLFGRAFHGTPDTLEGYTTAEIEITDTEFLAKGEHSRQLTAVVSADKTDSIRGTVLEMTEEELLEADDYEPDNFERIRVELASGKEAWLYVAIEI